MPNHPAQDPNDTYWSDGADVPVFQRPAEFDALLDLYRERAPRRVLEVGTYYGGTLRQWLRLAAPGAVVVSVDRYDIPDADNRYRYAEWTPDGVTLHAIVGDSHAMATLRAVDALGPFDWVFIDAGHSYHEVAADYRNYGAMLAPGAVIALHDIVADPARHPEIEVPRLWSEIRASGAQTVEYVQDYAAPWGGIGVVFG